MFAIKLSMEKQIKKFWAAGFSDLTAINTTVLIGNHHFFTKTCHCQTMPNLHKKKSWMVSNVQIWFCSYVKCSKKDHFSVTETNSNQWPLRFKNAGKCLSNDDQEREKQWNFMEFCCFVTVATKVQRSWKG